MPYTHTHTMYAQVPQRLTLITHSARTVCVCVRVCVLPKQGDSLASTSVGSRLSGGAHTEPSGLTHPQPRSATHSTSGATAHNGSTTHPHTIPHSVSTATLPRNTHTKHSHDHHVRRSSTEAALPHTAGDAAQGAPRPPPPPRAGDAHGAVAQDGVLTGAALSVAFEEFGAQYATRKGLYVQLLGEGVQLIGERGTKVRSVSTHKHAHTHSRLFLTALLVYGASAGGKACN